MVATYTTRGRALQQEYATNNESWGNELNIGGLSRMDEMWGVQEVTVDADVTLTVENALEDQSRQYVLILSGAGGFTVTAPAVDKPYFVVNNCTADVNIGPQSGTTAVVRAGKANMYYTNAAASVGYVVDPTISDLKAADADIDAGSQKIINLADGTSNNDAINKSQLDALALDELQTPTGDVDLGSQKITNLADGSDANDAVNKSQLDGLLNLTPISEVAAIDTEVTQVAAIDTDVTTVATNIANINSVAGNETNINAVVSNATNINSVAGNSSNINSVATNETNINSAVTNETNINTVATNISDITTTASISANITSVAGNETNINSVASNSVNINTVATNMADILNASALVTGLTATDIAFTPAGSIVATTTQAAIEEISTASKKITAAQYYLGNI